MLLGLLVAASDSSEAQLISIALDLNFKQSDIGTVIVTSKVGTNLDAALYILDLVTGLVYETPPDLVTGTVIISLAGNTLTTNNGQFTLKPKQADITQNVESITKGNQNLNIAGVDGSITSSPQNFTAGQEFSFGWKVRAASSLVGIVKTDGDITATSGQIELIIPQDEADLINEDDSHFSVTNKAGLQTYAKGLTKNGLEIDSHTTPGSVKLLIDFTVYTGKFAFFGVSNKRGQIQPVNDKSSFEASEPVNIHQFVINPSTSGFQKLPSGQIEQWILGTASGSGFQTYGLPIAFPSAMVNTQITVFSDATPGAESNPRAAMTGYNKLTQIRLSTGVGGANQFYVKIIGV